MNDDSKRGPVFPQLRHFGTKKPPRQTLPRKREDWQTRFLSKVYPYGPLHPVLGTPCHIWQGGTQSSGYGHFKYEGKMHGAHRVAFKIAHGRWPMPHALHHCNTIRCVNPGHLYEGKVHVDGSAKGRVVQRLPTKSVELTPKEIAAIRKKFNGRNLKLLAKRYGITYCYATELAYTTRTLPRQETSPGVRA